MKSIGRLELKKLRTGFGGSNKGHQGEALIEMPSVHSKSKSMLINIYIFAELKLKLTLDY